VEEGICGKREVVPGPLFSRKRAEHQAPKELGLLRMSTRMRCAIQRISSLQNRARRFRMLLGFRTGQRDFEQMVRVRAQGCHLRVKYADPKKGRVHPGHACENRAIFMQHGGADELGRQSDVPIWCRVNLLDGYEQQLSSALVSVYF
jgi:hypothetical protein